MEGFLQVSEAEDDCNKALALDTGNVKALYRRALCKKVFISL